MRRLLGPLQHDRPRLAHGRPDVLRERPATNPHAVHFAVCGPSQPILVCVTTDPTQSAEPGRDAPGTWTPDGADTQVMGPFVPDATRAAPGRPRRRSGAIVVLSVALVLTLGLAGYLWMTTRAYRDLAASTEAKARVIGSDLASTRADLAGATDELAGVRAQLKTAQARITALADEKAQAGDAREAQRQLLDYQQRVSAAAGTVASALDQCVRGQDQLIGYLKNAGAYDPAQLQAFGTEVSGLCQSATDANKALQGELAK
jgi:hypothetical protein